MIKNRFRGIWGRGGKGGEERKETRMGGDRGGNFVGEGKEEGKWNKSGGMITINNYVEIKDMERIEYGAIENQK